MSDSDDPTSQRQLKGIDRIADEFERAFRQGPRPPIEMYLEKHPELLPNLLRDLLALEVELRRSSDEQPKAQDYLARFPQHRDVVESIFAEDVDMLARTKAASSFEAASEESIPKQLGRFVIKRPLGRGGFGVVYLAHDPMLERFVALKVPRRERFTAPEQVASFMQEARTAAKLKHPFLVAVHDVQELDGLPFIVQEYIDGVNLADWAAKNQPTFHSITKVLIDIADALRYAHQQDFTHCDLKLANVLMDVQGQPHVADFGLAIHQNMRLRYKGERFGTPYCMAPEQVRGEGHRLDGRTDIWALGVIMYELMVSRRPFVSNNSKELFNEIETLDPRPPRQIDRKVPRELERICLKCLSKRRTDRYSTTEDLRDELQHWLAQESALETPPSSVVATSLVASPDSDSESKPPAKIIPKGLRSFDAEDAEFFLQMLPGPRDRGDLPESIRFWKNKIEETDADKTFSVGLIYGPSGCGKSSLVKAGLLPRISDDVLPIYVEATSADTEVRILKQLRKHLPRISEASSLPDTFAELRTTGAGRQRKLLVVIDQFEQWLHAKKDESNTDLVQALRQCDGGRVQCIVMVRDDFWMAVTRFMRELEIRLIEGQNSAAVDLFPIRHAEKVLAAFGLAFGALPENLNDFNKEQTSFITQSVAGLAEEGKVNCVRLALFAEMVKGKSWTPTTLKEVGGTKGVGVTFLEETFSASTSPPEHRYHQNAARAVLTDLLPDFGTDIKGTMRSYAQLLEASGYGNRPRDFDDLVHILDSEIRLIMPTDSEGKEPNHDTVSHTQTGQRYFQLTHDYMVHSLREWLTRKQKETRRGRAELRLFDTSLTWNSQPKNRFLPSLTEWLGIRTLTDSKRWTNPQRAMMRSAGKLHGLSWGGGLMALLLICGAFQSWVSHERWKNQREQTRVAAEALQNNLGPSIPFNIKGLQKLPKELALPELTERFDATSNPRHKLALAFALAEYGRVEIDYLLSRIDDLADTDTGNFISALKFDRNNAIAALKSNATKCIDKATWRQKAKISIAALLLGNADLADDMCTIENRPDPEERTLFIDTFPNWECNLDEALSSVQGTESSALRSGVCLGVGSISSDLISDENKESWRKLASRWFIEKSDSTTHSAASWLLRQWNLPTPELPNANAIMPQRDWFVNSIGSTMVRIKPQPLVIKLVDPIEKYREDLAKFASATQAELEDTNLLIVRSAAYYYAGQPEEAIKDMDRLLSIAARGRQRSVRQLRTLALAKLGKVNQAKESLAEFLKTEKSLETRFLMEIQVAAWLGETDVAEQQLETATLNFQNNSSMLYRLASASALCAQATEVRSPIVSKKFIDSALKIMDRLRTSVHGEPDRWIRNPDFAILHGDPQFVAKLQNWKTLDEFWVSNCEVTLGQFEKFFEDDKVAVSEKPEKWDGVHKFLNTTEEHPVHSVSWYDAVKYCNWLSVKEGRSPSYRRSGTKEKGGFNEEMYDVWEDIPGATGYRLLREAEWEHACRAGTKTEFSSGEDETLLVKYSQMDPSKSTAIAGSKLANGWGLHDMHGNVSEWCFDKSDSEGSNRVDRGGYYFRGFNYCGSADRSNSEPSFRFMGLGFRLGLSASSE